MEDSREKIWVSGPPALSDDDIWKSVLQTDGIWASPSLTNQTNPPLDWFDEIWKPVPPIDQTNPIQEFSREQEKTDLAPLQDRNSQQETPGSLPLHVETNREKAAETSAKPRRGRKKREQGKTDLGPLQDRNSQQEAPGSSPLHVGTNHGHQLNQVAETSSEPSRGGRKRKLSETERRENKRNSDRKHRLKLKGNMEKLKSDKENVEKWAKEMHSENQELKNCLQRLAKEVKLEKKEMKPENEALKNQIQRLEKNLKEQKSQSDELQGQNNNVNEMIMECLALIQPSNANVPAAAAEFFRKLEEDKESNVKSKDFAGLDENREDKTVGKYQIPLSLVPTAEKIIEVYGDVCATSTINRTYAQKIYILFCATIKEMTELPLENVTEKTMLKWRDAIKDALYIKFKVEFAMEHLKKTIARRYFGMKAFEEAEKIDGDISKIEAYLNDLKDCKKCIGIAKEFDDQPFSEGLWG